LHIIMPGQSFVEIILYRTVLILCAKSMACQWTRGLVLFFTLVMLVPAIGTSAERSKSAGPQDGVSVWHAFRGDASRSGVISGEGPRSNDTLWSFDSGNSIQSSPVFDGGLAFFGNDAGRFYAVRLSNGTEVWNRSMGQWAMIWSTANVQGGTVYIGSINGSDSALFALNASDGSVIWQVPSDQGIVASPVYYAGAVYSASQNGSVIAVNASSGKVLWLTMRGGEIQSSPAVVGDTLYCGTTIGEVFALWTSNGTVRWNLTRPAGWTVYSTPAVIGGRIYIAISNYSALKGELLALDASTGSVIWRFVDSNGMYSSPAVSNDAVYAYHW